MEHHIFLKCTQEISIVVKTYLEIWISGIK